MNMSKRFRGFLPVVVDIETAGFNAETDAILEIAAVLIEMTEDGSLQPGETIAEHVLPFEGSHLEPSCLEFTKIDPYHPFRYAKDEGDALNSLFKPIREAIKANQCSRAVLVGHNPAFDQSFLKAAVKRNNIKHDPFHLFTTFDTATLGGLAVGETVLVKACRALNIPFDQKEAHSAIYDAQRTAELFCNIVNRWKL